MQKSAYDQVHVINRGHWFSIKHMSLLCSGKEKSFFFLKNWYLLRRHYLTSSLSSSLAAFTFVSFEVIFIYLNLKRRSY